MEGVVRFQFLMEEGWSSSDTCEPIEWGAKPVNMQIISQGYQCLGYSTLLNLKAPLSVWGALLSITWDLGWWENCSPSCLHEAVAGSSLLPCMLRLKGWWHFIDHPRAHNLQFKLFLAFAFLGVLSMCWTPLYDSQLHFGSLHRCKVHELMLWIQLCLGYILHHLICADAALHWLTWDSVPCDEDIGQSYCQKHLDISSTSSVEWTMQTIPFLESDTTVIWLGQRCDCLIGYVSS